MSFRSQLVKRFKSCLVSRYHATECEAAHIVPRWVVRRLQPDLMTDSTNGLLLARSVHVSFDQYFWTFDVFGGQLITNGRSPNQWAWLPIYVKSNRSNRLINQFHGQYFKIPVASLPYLWLHQQLFLKVNYNCNLASIDHNSDIPIEMYSELMSSQDYQSLMIDPNQLFSTNIPEEKKEPQIIINHRKFGAEYQLVRKYTSLFEAKWVSDYQLPEELIDEYQELRNNR